jgi:hypothetical protein
VTHDGFTLRSGSKFLRQCYADLRRDSLCLVHCGVFVPSGVVPYLRENSTERPERTVCYSQRVSESAPREIGRRNETIRGFVGLELTPDYETVCGDFEIVDSVVVDLLSVDNYSVKTFH